MNYCNHCNFKCDNYDNLKCHSLYSHSTQKERELSFSYYCKICDYGSFHKNKYGEHLSSSKHIRKSKNRNTLKEICPEIKIIKNVN